MWVRSRLDEEKREQFEMELETPLAGEAVAAGKVLASPAQVEEENAALAAIIGVKGQIESR